MKNYGKTVRSVLSTINSISFYILHCKLAIPKLRLKLTYFWPKYQSFNNKANKSVEFLSSLRKKGKESSMRMKSFDKILNHTCLLSKPYFYYRVNEYRRKKFQPSFSSKKKVGKKTKHAGFNLLNYQLDDDDSNSDQEE